MLMSIARGAVIAAAMGLSAPAFAAMPIFSAECPQQNYIDADRTGTVRVNGAVASVQQFNENYYEARSGNVTYPISMNPDGSGLQVGYNPRGSAGGYCTILASAPGGSSAGGGGSAGAGRVPEEDIFQVALSDPGGYLNIHSGPSGNTPVIGRLPDGVLLRNAGGCRYPGGEQWCDIEPSGGGVRGWVSGAYLAIPGPGGRPSGGAAVQLPTPPPQRPVASDGQTIRVQFQGGTSGAQYNGTLPPGGSTRYVLNARNGQFLDVRVASAAPRVTYQIFNPDRTFLLDQIDIAKPYRGQLWQTGDHVVEVINRGNAAVSYNVTFQIN